MSPSWAPNCQTLFEAACFETGKPITRSKAQESPHFWTATVLRKPFKLHCVALDTDLDVMSYATGHPLTSDKKTLYSAAPEDSSTSSRSPWPTEEPREMDPELTELLTFYEEEMMSVSTARIQTKYGSTMPILDSRSSTKRRWNNSLPVSPMSNEPKTRRRKQEAGHTLNRKDLAKA